MGLTDARYRRAAAGRRRRRARRVARLRDRGAVAVRLGGGDHRGEDRARAGDGDCSRRMSARATARRSRRSCCCSRSSSSAAGWSRARSGGGRGNRCSARSIGCSGFGFGALKGLIGATLLFLLANLATDTFYGGGAARPDWMVASRTFPLLNASSRAIVDFVAMRRGEGRACRGWRRSGRSAYVRSMSAALYNSTILRLATAIPHHERLADPDASVERRSPVCGSRVTRRRAARRGGARRRCSGRRCAPARWGRRRRR